MTEKMEELLQLEETKETQMNATREPGRVLDRQQGSVEKPVGSPQHLDWRKVLCQ